MVRETPRILHRCAQSRVQGPTGRRAAGMVVVWVKRKPGCNSLPQLHDLPAMLARRRQRVVVVVMGEREEGREGGRERRRKGETQEGREGGRGSR